jgi:hypothetical protein
MNAETGLRRFGPGGVWLAVLVPDLLLTGTVVIGDLAQIGDHQAEPDYQGQVFPQPSPTSILVVGVLLGLSLVGTCVAILRRGNHQQTVRGGIAFATIRLILLAAMALFAYVTD